LGEVLFAFAVLAGNIGTIGVLILDALDLIDDSAAPIPTGPANGFTTGEEARCETGTAKRQANRRRAF
jgi:hypothetical protein